MTIYCKVGTGPGEYCKLYRKRSEPKVGEVFKIIYKDRPTQVRCTERRCLQGIINLFLLELF